jgi:hypothetical protein
MATRRSRFAAVAVVALAASAWAAPAHAATGYYVDCSHSSNGDGSAASPWNTLASVNSKTFSPGEQILFARGSRCVGTLSPKGSGVAGSVNTVSAYGTGSLPVIDGNGAADTVLLSNQQYWEIRNLDVTNAASPGSARRGVRVTAQDSGVLSHIVLSGLTIHDILGNDVKDTGGSAGILVEVTGHARATHFDSVTISGNTLTNVDREGIYTTSSWRGDTAPNVTSPHTNVTISGNALTHLGGDGIVVTEATGTLVDHNTVAGFNTTSAGYNAGIWPYDADHTTIQYNDVSGGHGHLDSMGYDVDDYTDTTTIQYNYSHDNDGGFLLLCGTSAGHVRNATVRYNISQNDSYRGVEDCSAGIQSAAVYNNTIYVKPGAGMALIRENNDANTRHVQFTNNVVLNAGSTSDATFTLATATGYVLTDNVFRNTTSTPGIGTQTTDPLLSAPGTATGIGSAANGYRLCSGSPALASGIAVTANGGYDFFGNAIPAGSPNRGAYAGPGLPSCLAPNLLPGGDFESGSLSGWATHGASVVTDSAAYSGTHDLRLTATGSGYATTEYTVSGLAPTTTYVYSGWVRTNGSPTSLGVKNYGGTQVSTSSATTGWTQLTAVFTTGVTNTKATVFCYLPAAGTSSCDGLTVRKQ